MAAAPMTLFSLALVAASACTGTPGEAVSEDRDVAIYATVVRHMTAEEGEGSGFPVIYVLDRLVENAGAPEEPGAGTPLSQDDRAALREALDDLAPVEFVARQADVIGPMSQGARVKHGGIMLTLGPIGGDEYRALVPASSYLANLAGTWQTWVVERRDGGWKVTGTEGPVAIS